MPAPAAGCGSDSPTGMAGPCPEPTALWGPCIPGPDGPAASRPPAALPGTPLTPPGSPVSPSTAGARSMRPCSVPGMPVAPPLPAVAGATESSDEHAPTAARSTAAIDQVRVWFMSSFLPRCSCARRLGVGPSPTPTTLPRPESPTPAIHCPNRPAAPLPDLRQNRPGSEALNPEQDPANEHRHLDAHDPHQAHVGAQAHARGAKPLEQRLPSPVRVPP